MSELTCPKTPRSIQIYVSYEWSKEDRVPLPATRDGKWKALRELVKRVADEVKKRADNTKAEYPLSININRLRGRHGEFLLSTLRQRIEDGDIFIFDLGSSTQCEFNHNVLIELGMAIGLRDKDEKSIYVLKPVMTSGPSDLNGILYSDYSPPGDAGKLELSDKIGFTAAIRSTLIHIAKERGMMGTPL